MTPASWETLAARENRLLLACITPPDLVVTMDFAKAIRTLQLPPGSDWYEIRGMPFGPARNIAAQHAMRGNYNLAFLDADIKVNADAFMQLAGTMLDIVGGLYYQRFFPYMPVFFNDGRDDKGNFIRAPITGWKPGDIVPCVYLPSGLTLYRHHVLEAMFERFPTPFVWGADTGPIFDASGQVPGFSEDFVFSWRAQHFLGFQPFCHTGVIGLHECRAVVGPRWVLPFPSPDPLHGIVGIA